MAPLILESRGLTLHLFDEPMTELHFQDIRLSLNAFQEQVAGGYVITTAFSYFTVQRSECPDQRIM